MNDEKFFKAALTAWVVSAIVSIALVCAIIWGVIELVQWVTTK